MLRRGNEKKTLQHQANLPQKHNPQNTPPHFGMPSSMVEKIPQNGVDSLKGAVKEGPLNKEGPSGRVEVSSKMDIVNVEKALSSSNMWGDSALQVEIMEDSWRMVQNIPFVTRWMDGTKLKIGENIGSEWGRVWLQGKLRGQQGLGLGAARPWCSEIK